MNNCAIAYLRVYYKILNELPLKKLTLFFLICIYLYLPAQNVHDPVMIKQDSVYYLFCTGMGINCLSSKDMKSWKKEKSVFDKSPDWAVSSIPGFKGHIWAPDIYYHKGDYYLYYSVSAFGKNTSCIGLVTNKTLHPNSPDFKWIDHGKIIQSFPNRDLWNAIDPNLILDENGVPWLTFGSFWNGIKLVKLRDDLKSVAEPEEWYTLAQRARSANLDDTDPGDGAIEAPFIFRKDSFYYLFVSFDYCCRGIKSNYKIMVGRSQKVSGPYTDKEGKDLRRGGGSLLLEGNSQWPGVGHNAVYTFNNTDFIIYHAYDASDNGKPKLKINILQWDNANWPLIGEELKN
jgi:arabinan endo-1,5-alpha-L-arabinosidase